jgi:hypothetical protein
VFFLANNTNVNLDLVKNKLIESNYISSDDKFDINVLKELLVKKFETIDYIDAKEDVIPFIKDVHSLDLWNKDLFVSITNDMQ